VHEVQTTRGVVKLVDVRIDSKPAGATVMLVDNGKTSFLGTTPVAASVDPSRAYDVIFTLEGRPTQMTHLDPIKVHHLDVTLAGPSGSTTRAARTSTAKAAPAAKVAAAAEPPVAHHQKAVKPAELAEPSFDMPVKATPKAPTKAAAPDVGGTGMLMVSSKPPCEIIVDGKPTGLSTPQRAMPLSPGAHKITLVNAQENIKKTVSVAISADTIPARRPCPRLRAAT
jgi:hypothetical protein